VKAGALRIRTGRARCALRAASAAVLVLGALTLCAPRVARADPADAGHPVAGLVASLPSLSDAQRREQVAKLAPEQRAALMRALDTPALVAMGVRAADALGSYRMTLTKEERVRGKRTGAQKATVWVQPSPFAVRLQFIDGPAKGRHVLYNSALRPGQIRAREGGFLGMAGGIWIAVDHRLTRGDTNHAITDVGFAPLMARIRGAVERSLASGRPYRSDEGLQAGGSSYCLRLAVPPADASAGAESLRLCIDPVLGLPVRAEIADADGMLEWSTYESIEGGLVLPVDHFTPEGAGI
jgi:hypothetical protein